MSHNDDVKKKNLFYKRLKLKNKNITVILKHVHFRRTDRLLHPVSSVKRFYSLTGDQWLTLPVPIFNHPSSSRMSQDLSVHLWVISSKRNISAANIHKCNKFVTTKDCSPTHLSDLGRRPYSRSGLKPRRSLWQSSREEQLLCSTAPIRPVCSSGREKEWMNAAVHTHIMMTKALGALDKGSARSQRSGSRATLWCCPARAQTRCEDGTNAARPPWWSLRGRRRETARGAPKQTLWLSIYMMCFYLWYIFFVIMGCAVCRTLRRKIKSHFQG